MKKTETYIGGKSNAFSLDISQNNLINEDQLNIILYL
jgi:hypothetical protein